MAANTLSAHTLLPAEWIDDLNGSGFDTQEKTEFLLQQRLAQSVILRDLGNPFRPVTLDPSWLTPTVRQLAQAVYDERLLPSGELQLDRLGVLADALEDADCPVPPIIDHLRGRGPHVRGCFVVDLLLNKS